MSRRTLEEIASGPALVARYQKAGGRAENGWDVLVAAGNDATAREIIVSAAAVLGSQLGLLVNVLDPEALVIGGGLGLSEGIFWEQLVAGTRRHIWSDAHRALPILRAATGADAGWIGAALRAAQRFSATRHNSMKHP